MAHQLNLVLPVPLNKRQQAVYDALFAAVQKDEPCPTNPDLAEAANLSSDGVCSALNELEKLGMIRRMNQAGGWRTIVVVALGKGTRTAKRPMQGEVRLSDMLTADERHRAALAGMSFEDHPKAKTGKSYPKFYPARHQAYGHEAMC